MLQEARRQDRGQDAPPPSPCTPSLRASRVSQGPGDESTQGVTPSQSKGEHRRLSSSSSTARVPPPLSAVDTVDNDDVEQPAASVLPSEATAFLGENEEYYARAGLQRRRSFGFQIGKLSTAIAKQRLCVPSPGKSRFLLLPREVCVSVVGMGYGMGLSLAVSSSEIPTTDHRRRAAVGKPSALIGSWLPRKRRAFRLEWRVESGECSMAFDSSSHMNWDAS